MFPRVVSGRRSWRASRVARRRTSRALLRRPRSGSSRVVFSLVIAVLWLSPLRAESVISMNLRELSGRADKVFRGTVVSATHGTAVLGGGELPTVTYRIRVEESFKGEFQEVKGTRFAEVRMLSGGPHKAAGPLTGLTRFLALPRLEVGRSYVLLTTRPSSAGLSAPVGLGQGCFRVDGPRNAEEAVNGHGNKLLFRGMDPEPGPAGKPLKYSRLAERLRSVVREERRQR